MIKSDSKSLKINDIAECLGESELAGVFITPTRT